MNGKVYHWGGNLPPDSPVYIDRPEDDTLQEHILSGNYVTLLGPRQMGKTSLLYKTQRRLTEKQLAIPALVDLSPTREETLEGFYSHITETIALQILPEYRPDHMPRSHLAFLEVLSDLIKRVDSPRIVVMLDEVGMVPTSFSDPFFSNIRYIFSNRHVRKEFSRLVFVLCGTFQPRDLIKNSANSPFNISKTVRMSDFTLDAVKKLLIPLERMGLLVTDGIAEEIHRWTGGQPYLTQRLCATFEDWRIPLTGPEVVQAAVKELMMEDINLDHILHRIQREPALLPWLERIIVKKAKIRFNRMTNPRLAKLELIGVITPGKDGNVKVRNRIYHDLLYNHLTGEIQPETPSPESYQPSSQECTAVCIDVVNSTLLKQNADKVDVTYTFGQYHKYVSNLVRRFGGHVKDAAGDGTMCIFTDADKAVECCKEIQYHLPSFNRRHNRLGNRGIQLRIGVNTGKVLATDPTDSLQTRDLYDYTLDLAGKVQKGAGNGEIAITEHTKNKLTTPVDIKREEYWPEYDVKIYVVDINPT